MQATETGAIETSTWLHPGVADGIEPTRRCRGNQAGQKKLLARKWKRAVGKATLSGSLTEGNWLGMRAGIAKKSGNADGVKALTAIDRWRTNICYPQR